MQKKCIFFTFRGTQKWFSYYICSVFREQEEGVGIKIRQGHF